MFAALAICRFVHYAAVMSLFGASVFVWMLAPRPLAVRLGHPAWRFAIVVTLVSGVSAIGWLLLEAGMMGDGWPDALRSSTIVAVLFDTGFGRSWQLHGALIVCLAAFVALRLGWLTCGFSALVLASLGLVGHAAMHSDLGGWLHRGNLALHLLFAGYWLGGLLPLVASMQLAREPGYKSDAVVALRRFSTGGHAAVAGVLLTGAANTALIVGGSFLKSDSPYRILLAAKIALVLVMVALAVLNRYWIVPALRTRPHAARYLLTNSAAEFGLGVVVVALVSLFGLLDPHA